MEAWSFPWLVVLNPWAFPVVDLCCVLIAPVWYDVSSMCLLWVQTALAGQVIKFLKHGFKTYNMYQGINGFLISAMKFKIASNLKVFMELITLKKSDKYTFISYHFSWVPMWEICAAEHVELLILGKPS